MYHNEHTHFCHKMCSVVDTRFLKIFWCYDGNYNLNSSKALKWVLI